MSGLPKRFPDRAEIAAVRAEAEPLDSGAEADTTRRVAGRVMGRRGHGGLVFLDLVDRSGRIQLLCDTSPAEENWRFAPRFSSGRMLHGRVWAEASKARLRGEMRNAAGLDSRDASEEVSCAGRA